MEESKLIPVEPIPTPTLREDGRGIDWSSTFDILSALPPGASREIPVISGIKAVDFMSRLRANLYANKRTGGIKYSVFSKGGGDSIWVKREKGRDESASTPSLAPNPIGRPWTRQIEHGTSGYRHGESYGTANRDHFGSDTGTGLPAPSATVGIRTDQSPPVIVGVVISPISPSSVRHRVYYPRCPDRRYDDQRGSSRAYLCPAPPIPDAPGAAPG